MRQMTMKIRIIHAHPIIYLCSDYWRPLEVKIAKV